jgi:chemotaxis signal transduction protein
MAVQDEKDAQTLEQMTDEEFWQCARAEAARAATVLAPPGSASFHQYLECDLQRGKCFVPLPAIEAVVPATSPLARLPFAPRWLRGVQGWRGEIVAVVDVDDYLSGHDIAAGKGMLLITRHPACAIGLRVAAVGLTTSIEPEQLQPAATASPLYSSKRADVVQGLYDGYPVLDMDALLGDVTLQIEMAAHHD